MKPEINPNISIIGAAMDLGGCIPGAALGPLAVRYAKIEDRLLNFGYVV